MGDWWPMVQEAAVTARDGIGLDDILAFIAGATAILTFLSVWVIRPLRRLTGAIEGFLDDWGGIPARPGHDPVPGIPERIQRIEREVQRNGGQSLKDRVFAIDRKLDALAEAKEREHAEIRASVEQLRTTVESKECR